MSNELEVKGSALRVDRLCLSFGGLTVLSDVSFDVSPGGVLGIVGSNGSGKTSLLNCVSGIYSPHSGSIYLDREEITRLSPHKVTRRGIARTFQHIEIPLDLKVVDLAMLGRQAITRSSMLYFGIGIPFLRALEKESRKAALDSIALLGLTEHANTLVGDLPYGLAKQADIARAVAQQPRVLLLDEPAAGLNEEERNDLAGLISQLTSTNLTIILVEHDMDFISKVCTEVVVMEQGQRIFRGAIGDALEDQAVIESLLGGRIT